MNIAEASLAIPLPYTGFDQLPIAARARPAEALASGPSLMTLTGNQESTSGKGLHSRREQTFAEKILSAMRKCFGGRLNRKAVHP